MFRLLLGIKKTLTRLLDWVLILAVGVLVVDVLWGVFSRFVLGHQANWTEELARVLLVWVGLLGSSLAFSAKGHLGVDFLVAQFSPSARKAMAVAVNLIVLFFASAVLLAGGIRLVRETLALGQLMPALGVPKGYVYLAVPISGVFTILFCVEALLELVRERGVRLPQGEDEGLPAKGDVLT